VQNDALANLSNGIDSAYHELGVPKLIDAEDMAKGADELGNMTYLYHFMDKVGRDAGVRA
jgi:hypothetical protein